MLKNFTLLYVEDNKITVDQITDILQGKVKELFTAYNGEEGLALYKEKKPDIVLTDIHMPKMNGLEMAKAIKQINEEQAIIVLTAFNENTLLHESVDIGVEGYITKPIIDIDKMLKPIEKTAERLQANITQKNLEHLLEVQGKTAAVGEMVSNIAHQWRQPLNVISNMTNMIYASVLTDKEIDKEDIMVYSKGINSQALYLSKTINDFRNFLNASTTESSHFSLKNTVEQTYKLTEPSLKENKIICIKQLDDISIEGNENQLIQAFINIFNNTKDVLIDNKQEEKYFFISLIKKENSALIIFKDNGGGIREDVVDRIFEPYFTTKHPSVGTGIGLYITFNSITKVFNGTIEAENIEYEYEGKKLKGAQFVIEIPLDSAVG